MRYRALITLLSLAIVMLVGCRKNVVIPDDTLSDIFHDAFLSNAYKNVERIDIDSLQIYESIFNHYGYTAEDVRYTIGNFSRRKSARLGSVVEQAIARLEREAKVYKRQVVILDTVRNAAVRSMQREVYADTLIKVRKRADSTRLEIDIEPVLPGEYTISYEYEYEDDVKRHPRRAEFYFEGESGGRMSNISFTLRKTEYVRRTIRATEHARRLHLNLGMLTGKRRPKRQMLTLRNLRVNFKPDADMAIDSMFKRYVDIKIFADGFLFPAKDSLTLSADTTRVQ